jgi:hypothetical protein
LNAALERYLHSATKMAYSYACGACGARHCTAYPIRVSDGAHEVPPAIMVVILIACLPLLLGEMVELIQSMLPCERVVLCELIR